MMDSKLTAEGLFIGDAAIRRLLEKSDKIDSGTSSHWQERLKDFHVSDGRPAGYRGFGEQILNIKPHRKFGHFIMQTPYRRMGQVFDKFEHFYSVGKKVAKGQGRVFDYDMLRQVLTTTCNAEYFVKMIPDSLFCVIGDGFGSLTSILLEGVENSRVALVNLTQVLAVDLINIQKIIPDIKFAVVETEEALTQAFADKSISLIGINADQQKILCDVPLGFVFNTVSMGEMNSDIVAEYFATMRLCQGATSYFYCSNRQEKELPDGTMTRFDDYPWAEDDQIIFDELTPWHQASYQYFPPKYIPFDGPIRHRLVRMSK